VTIPSHLAPGIRATGEPVAGIPALRFERQHIDKSSWPAGPWDTEPDEIRWIDDDTGILCVIWRHPDWGQLNGYVLISDTMSAANLTPDTLHVHGGVTFCDWLTDPDGTELGFAVGFDCTHAYDHAPGLAQQLADAGVPAFTDAGTYNHEAALLLRSAGQPTSVYRDVAYVTDHVLFLADQIALNITITGT
jgi:hypothetical protein